MKSILVAAIALFFCLIGIFSSAQPAPEIGTLIEKGLPPLALFSVLSDKEISEFQQYTPENAAKELQKLREEGVDKEFAAKFCAYLLKGMTQGELKAFLGRVGLPLYAGEISFLINFIVDADNFGPLNRRVMKNNGYQLQAKVLDDNSTRVEVLLLNDAEKKLYCESMVTGDLSGMSAELGERLCGTPAESEGLIILGTDNAAKPVIRTIDGKKH